MNKFSATPLREYKNNKNFPLPRTRREEKFPLREYEYKLNFVSVKFTKKIQFYKS